MSNSKLRTTHSVFTKVVRPVPDAPTTITVNWRPFLTLLRPLLADAITVRV